MTSYEIVAKYIPEPIRSAMQRADSDKVTEIRFRSGRAVSYIYPNKIKYLSESGVLKDTPENCIKVTSAFISDIVDSLSHYSLHSCNRELRQGFFTLESGIRVGIAGTYTDTGIIRDFNALNFRISRNVRGCGNRLFGLKGSGILICGGVNSGKTTVLRDLCRLFGNICKVSLIDERGEISSPSGGNILNDVGILTDVIAGCERSDGIISAIRTLSPEYIFCDEISTHEDKLAILNGAGSGVKFVSTIHAENFNGLMKRHISNELISAGVFDYAVFLYGSDKPSEIREIRRLNGDS